VGHRRRLLEVHQQVEQISSERGSAEADLFTGCANTNLALGNLAAPAVLGDRHRLVQSAVRQGRQVFEPGGRPRELPD